MEPFGSINPGTRPDLIPGMPGISTSISSRNTRGRFDREIVKKI